MKTVYLFTFSFLLSLMSAATSIKSPQAVLFLNIRSLLEIYKTTHNDLPESWQEFIDSGVFTDQILNDSRRLLDLENRYMFIDLKPIQIENRIERVLIMARQAGGEGDNNEAEEPEKRKGRWLIVEASDGSIHTRKYSEVMLKHWFDKAGLSLVDFTSDAPPPPEFNPLPKEPNSEGVALGGPENPSGGKEAKKEVPTERPEKRQPVTSGKSSDSIAEKPAPFPWWLIVSSVAIFALALVTWLKLRKAKPTF